MSLIRSLLRGNLPLVDVALVWILGGSVAVGGMSVDLPGFRQLKSLVITDDDVAERISFDSPHTVAVVRTVLRAGEDLDYKITRVSSRADEFYAASLSEIVQWSAEDDSGLRKMRFGS